MTWLPSKALFKIFLFVPVFYGFHSWTPPLVGLADPYSPAKAVSRLTPSPGLQILHQGMVSQVHISLDHGLKDNGHSIADGVLRREAVQLLMDYPAKYDYWEVVNLSITHSLLEAYPQLEYVTLRLDILPSDRIQYHRVSTVTRWSHGDISESWRFEVPELPVQGISLNAAIDYSYTDGAIYPDFLEIRQRLVEYLNGPAAKSMSLEKLERILAQHLLQQYSEAITDISISFE